MEISQLKSDIKNRTLKPFYIFYGDEWKVQEIYIDKMASIVGNKVYADSFKDVYTSIKSASFFKRNNLYIVRDDPDLLTNEALLNRLPSILGDNVLVLTVFKPDKRSKLYRTYKLSFLEFIPLKTPYLRSYIQREIKLNQTNTDTLIEVCENNYGRILSEIDKIKKYGGDSYDEIFNILLKDGTIYEPPVSGADVLAEEIIKGNVNNSFDVLYQCVETGTPTLVMIAYLYNSVRDVLQVKTCHSNDVCKSTGLPYWRVKKAKERMKYRSEEELMNMLKLIHEVEIGVKTGKIEDSVAMQYLLTNLL